MPALDNPLIVQSDRSILLEVDSPRYEAARDALVSFAELEKSPEHVHTYRVTAISLWNAAAAGLTVDEIIARLERFSRYPVPPNVLADIREIVGRYGKIQLVPGEPKLELVVRDELLALELAKNAKLGEVLEARDGRLWVSPLARGAVKQKLARYGYPVDDRVGFVDGEAFLFELGSATREGEPFALRPYQLAAADTFLQPSAGHGVIVLPCGAGKTAVGMAIAARLKAATLVLCTGVTALRQWKRELLDKTTLTPGDIGEYSGARKEIRPITLTTYNIMSLRRGESFPHLELFSARPWGLIIYDEVHLLPAPVFRVTAELQARRRLGLTATLVREDGLETDVFSLIGPKRYDVPWKEMEQGRFIAEAVCHEIRVEMPPAVKVAHAALADEPQLQYRVAAENPAKDEAVRELVAKHAGEGILVIGQYVRQLRRIAEALGAPLITGEVPQHERDELYARFRAGELRQLVVSRVANFSIDLPDASVCIQVSGTFGSRQEEAQRLGRILRPKARQACFYSLVSPASAEMRFAQNRQLFLAEQGYRYYIEDWALRGELPAVASSPDAPLAQVIPFPGRSLA